LTQTILIIEDEKRIAEWIHIYLERSGFSATIAYDGKEGLQLARSLDPDLIILDLMLPHLDGMEICRILREESEVPIIMLTAKGQKSDKINGLDSGADDYIVKPFDADELVLRVKAVLRRYKGRVQNQIQCGQLIMNEGERQVVFEGKPLKLSQIQFELLAVFMHHPNTVLSRNQLIEQAFNNHYDSFDRAIDSHIRRLRKIIHKKGFQPIQTIYGAGYKLVC
jgi:DNA-binding response OmpR family regulator